MKITSKQYATALYELVKDEPHNKIESVVSDFIKTLFAHKSLAKANDIIAKFEEIWNQDHGILEAKVTSARELTGADAQMIEKYLEGITGAKNVKIEKNIDEKILGGVIIKYLNTVVDGSLRARVGELRKKMIK